MTSRRSSGGDSRCESLVSVDRPATDCHSVEVLREGVVNVLSVFQKINLLSKRRYPQKGSKNLYGTLFYNSH